jgi:predicted phosphoribosyltransferase
MPFRDRRHAGAVLAARLERYANRPDVVVLALPRGGVPVAFEVARALRTPLDVFLVRKLGAPGQEELALGAIASGGVRILNQEIVRELGITALELEEVAAREDRELRRREELYRGSRPRVPVAGRAAILVDDGLATGASMKAAVAALRREQPAAIVVAVPVGAPDTCALLRPDVDDVVCALTPEPLMAVGAWYEDFTQTSDAEVRRLLDEAARVPAA